MQRQAAQRFKNYDTAHLCFKASLQTESPSEKITRTRRVRLPVDPWNRVLENASPASIHAGHPAPILSGDERKDRMAGSECGRFRRNFGALAFAMFFIKIGFQFRITLRILEIA